MTNIVDFTPYIPDREWDSMSREELVACLDAVRAQIARLDEEEPEDMDSEEYALWGDRHEMLEDLLDDISDRLDEAE